MSTNDGGAVEHWQCENGAPNALARMGWTRNSLKSEHAARLGEDALRQPVTFELDGDSYEVWYGQGLTDLHVSLARSAAKMFSWRLGPKTVHGTGENEWPADQLGKGTDEP